MSSIVENHFVSSSGKIITDTFVQPGLSEVHGCITLDEFRAKFPELDFKSSKFYFDKYRFISSDKLSVKQKDWLISIDFQIMVIKDLRDLRKNIHKMTDMEKGFISSVKPNVTPKQKAWIDKLVKKYV